MHAKGRVWWGRLALLLSPVLLIAPIEGLARLRGYGGYPPVFREIGDVDGARLVELDWQGSASYFFSARAGRGASRQQSFFMPKPAGVYRILLAGESAARGYPHPLPLTAGAFLEAMLEAARPGVDVEVINMGTTAVASYPVYDMVRQALPYQPDVVIVYAGNNEFSAPMAWRPLTMLGPVPPRSRLRAGCTAWGLCNGSMHAGATPPHGETRP